MGVRMLMPREKITVLLVGNHSAGKSSFINWYIEEKVGYKAMSVRTVFNV